MYRLAFVLWILLLGSIPAAGDAPADDPDGQPLRRPTLADFWNGKAEWVMETRDVGLPVGESDTVYRGDGEYWSYLHASYESAGVIDQCGEPVAFPGCMTRWESTDGGRTFTLPSQVCAIPCESCPCQDQVDQQGVTANGDRAAAQQYPRVAFTDDTVYMAYEWHAQTVLRKSPDGLTWQADDWEFLRTPGGTWPSSYAPCSEVERIGSHPNIRGEVHDCLLGAPPGVYVQGDTLYVFVGAGSAPAHIRCYKGNRHEPLDSLKRCMHDPLFTGATTYGPEDEFGAAANDYFDFRYISSAEVMQVGERYYMLYEGIRGPDVLERGMDTQFGLGMARSVGSSIDGPWEKFPNNPILTDMTFNWGIGHADLVVVDGVTFMYTATSRQTRGRYVLKWTR